MFDYHTILATYYVQYQSDLKAIDFTRIHRPRLIYRGAKLKKMAEKKDKETCVKNGTDYSKHARQEARFAAGDHKFTDRSPSLSTNIDTVY